MGRGKLIAVITGAAALAAAVVLLRAETPPAETVTTPDGRQIRAFHDPQRITPPTRPEAAPRPPGELRLEQRRNGVLVTWPAAPFGFEVRWGRTGGPPDNVSYHATSGTTLRNLEPGRYRVEVRSVDGIGQRSTPASAEFDASDQPPEWQRGLGFVADFGTDPTLDPTRWRISRQDRRCFGRDDSPDPVLLVGPGCGFSRLRPASPLVLGEPDASGILGRVVVITDAPQIERLGASLTIITSPTPSRRTLSLDSAIPAGSVGQLGDLPPDAIGLQLTPGRAVFAVGHAIEPPRSPGEHKPPTTGTLSHGALHRWELVFAIDRIEARRNGELVAAAPISTPWRQAMVDISIGQSRFGGPGALTPTQIALVALTGPAPDPRPVQVLDLGTGPASVEVSGAVAARLIAAVDFAADVHPALVVDVEAPPGSLPLPITLPALDPGRSTAFAAELPAELLTGPIRLTLRPPADEFFPDQILLELTYPAGTGIDVAPLEIGRLPPADMPMPSLLLRSPETSSVLSDGERTRATKHQVEVRMDGAVQAGSLLPWLAVQVDLDDHRILTMPTAAAGPAIAVHYEFTVDLTGMPAGTHSLVVTLVPDRPGVALESVRHTVRLGG